MGTAPPAILQARYPLPDWTVDFAFKRDLTRAVAEAIAAETARWPAAAPVEEHAARVTAAARAALSPHLAWLDDTLDGFGHPGDVLVAYIGQLALTRPGEHLTPDRYRRFLRIYARHLDALADTD